MFPGGFGRPPLTVDDDMDEDDEEAMAAAMLGRHMQAGEAGAGMGGPFGQQGNMSELLALADMLSGGESSRAGAQDAEDEEQDDLDDVDETFSERLVGLTEMFPDVVGKTMVAVVGSSLAAAKWAWVNGQALAWAITATSMIAVMPVVLERERHQFHQEQLAQQRQILLGPGAASPSSAGHNMYGGLVPPALSGGGK